MVGISIESSAEAEAQSVEFGAEDLHSNVTGSSTGSRTLNILSTNMFKWHKIQKEIFKFLHRGIVRSGVLGHGLHVRVDKAGDLQICFFQEGISKSSHQTHGQLGLEQNDSSDHTELCVKSLVHEQLDSQILDLIHRDQCCK